MLAPNCKAAKIVQNICVSFVGCKGILTSFREVSRSGGRTGDCRVSSRQQQDSTRSAQAWARPLQQPSSRFPANPAAPLAFGRTSNESLSGGKLWLARLEDHC